MGKLAKVLEVKAGDNTSTIVGKELLVEGLRYAIGFGTIGMIFIGIGKMTETKQVEEIPEEEQGE